MKDHDLNVLSQITMSPMVLIESLSVFSIKEIRKIEARNIKSQKREERSSPFQKKIEKRVTVTQMHGRGYEEMRGLGFGGCRAREKEREPERRGR